MKKESLKEFELLNDEEAINTKGGEEWCFVDTLLGGCTVEMELCRTIEVGCSGGFTWDGDCYESTCPSSFTTCTQPD
ncbi:hypothetical protein L21SP5_00451 [Salinivirga cyanobacteriivorans]|uniref:Uncharacterized protein n=1 Tax=Salinivirga cyanobacteriivorans TaxID=1307839 RepID=A0A0S2HVR6_9BACT|nr:hypothetical protein [Salinivirga cyanobacteriivorans]ALO14130.1 hypothetical protein L21SP5_00451 [Salinivirga cyanobacteriivorans]